MQEQKVKAAPRVNWPAVIVLIVYPLLIVVGATLFSIYYNEVRISHIICLISSYYISNISVGVGLHRLWAHASFKASKALEAILMVTSAFCLQGPVLAWVTDHKFHHAYVDKELDPHSPLKYQSKLKGFLWSHIGWMLVGEATYKHISRAVIQSLGRNKLLVFQCRYYWQLTGFLNIVLPMLIGYIFIDHSLVGALGAFLFVGVGRAIQQQVTFCVNSVCHIVGKKRYCNDSSHDVWWMFFLLLGENWHNFHHAFAKDYRNGHKWYHADVHKWIIWGLSKLGLASNLVVTSRERIEAKMTDMAVNVNGGWHEQLTKVNEAAHRLAAMASQRIHRADKIMDSLKEIRADMVQRRKRVVLTLKQRVAKLESSALSLAKHTQLIINEVSFQKELSQKNVARVVRRLRKLEDIAERLKVC